MAGSLRLLIPFTAWVLLAPILGETAAEKPASPPPGKNSDTWLGGVRKGPKNGTPSPEFENVRRALDALTPEQRKRFQENFWRWSNLPPEEKKALREREEMRKKFMQQETEVALRESGLLLDGERRQEFIKRYGEERRKIEESLREEIGEKRKPMVHELVGRLRKEFSDSTSTPASSIR